MREPTREERRAQRKHDAVIERLNHKLWKKNLPPFEREMQRRLKERKS